MKIALHFHDSLEDVKATLYCYKKMTETTVPNVCIIPIVTDPKGEVLAAIKKNQRSNNWLKKHSMPMRRKPFKRKMEYLVSTVELESTIKSFKQ